MDINESNMIHNDGTHVFNFASLEDVYSNTFTLIHPTTLHMQMIYLSLNVIICSDLAAGSFNLVIPFCDVSGGISPSRHALMKHLFNLEHLYVTNA